MNIVERFINYCKIPTMSDPNSGLTPSSKKQHVLADLLVQEMKDLGVSDAYKDDNCIVYGHILSNVPNCEKKMGFIAHMDTSFDMNDEGCNPKIIANYGGEDIVLNDSLNIVLSPKQFPCLLEDKGADLIVTDGTTLLGGDDKAGIAEIMDMIEYLHTHPEYKHCNISIAFTPDEEIGEGADHFDLQKFNANYAYTVDGGDVSAVDFENFNAASAKVKINGLSIHPGEAKDKMINALLVAMEFNALLPEKDRPVNSQGYEGFNHLTDMKGDVETAYMEYIIRNHNKTKLEKQKDDFRKAKEAIDEKYGENTIELNIFDTYANMREIIEKHMEIVEQAKGVLKSLGVNPKSCAIRGGTDGASLTYKGLPCPNLGTGSRNCHGKFEYVNIKEMKIMARAITKLVEVN